MSLPERVQKIGVRWHQRTVVRRWPDATEAPFEIVVSENAEGPEGSNSALAIELDVSTVDGIHHIGMRGAVKLDDEHLLAIIDTEIQAAADGEPPTDDELVDFAQGWGHDYLMGYLRVGLADSAAQVGVQNLAIPPSYATRPDRESAAELVTGARDRAAAKADAQSV